MTALVLRTHAVLTAVVGLFFLAATWDGLYRALGMPHPDEGIYVQIGGAAAVALAYLLWIAPRNDRVTQAVAAASAIANALAAVIVATWLFHDGFDTWARVGLVVFVAVSAAYAGAEGRIASRSIAMLVPGD